MSGVQPFSPNLLTDVLVILQFDFMRSAFLTGTVTALVAGLVGYFVVLRRQTFAGDALSHVAFTGSLGALVVGRDPLVGLFGLTAIAGLGMGLLGERARARDEAIGTLLAWILGLGVLFLSTYTTRTSASNSTMGVNVLFGSILGLTPQQVHLTVPAGLLCVVLTLIIARPLLFASLDADVAASRGVPIRALGAGFMVLLGMSVAEAVPAVGALLVFALLITPAAIAQRLFAQPFAALAASGALAVTFTWMGLVAGFYTPLPVTFLISALASVAYLATALWTKP